MSGQAATSRRSGWRRAFYFACVFAPVAVVAYFAFGLAAQFWNMDQLNVRVRNQTSDRVTHATVQLNPDDAGTLVLDLGDLEPSGEASRSVHFGHDLGPAWFVATRSGRRIGGKLRWTLLNDNGPYDVTLTITPNGVLEENTAATKGTYRSTLAFEK
jgi:hypothetical protein